MLHRREVFSHSIVLIQTLAIQAEHHRIMGGDRELKNTTKNAEVYFT
jgi:hypothetical protein